MQKNGKRGGGSDRVLESRHLVMLFLSVVLLCGVFFTLGYVMGHTQYGAAPVHAENVPTHPTPAPAQPKKSPLRDTSTPTPTTKPPCDSSWDNCTNNPPEEKPVATPAPSKSKPKAEPIPNPKVSGPTTPVPIPGAAVKSSSPQPVSKNGIVLQVAAVKQQRDAIQMADELQKKKFPAFVVDSKADGFYHVQVGPYADKASAESARHALEDAGFKAIIKH
jgi:septal ring-binding cell division protein DamX